MATIEMSAWEPPEVQAKRHVATRQPWQTFGPPVAMAAGKWGFVGAERKVFLGDDAEVNGTMGRGYVSSFTPILNFIHALSYVFAATMAGRPFKEGWVCYLLSDDEPLEAFGKRREAGQSGQRPYRKAAYCSLRG